jgi:flagellar basal-body rod protein FlgF
MDSGYYAACTALAARTQALDTIANNLANANTAGYRAEHNIFSAVLATTQSGAGSNLSNAINNFGIVSGTSLDLSQGALQKTGNPLDLAIQGSAFFAVQTANGVMYTRNGSFQVSSTGQLITSTGDPVMGDKGPITMLPGPIVHQPRRNHLFEWRVAGKISWLIFPPALSFKAKVVRTIRRLPNRETGNRFEGAAGNA